mmetsp:Transcript_4249/g.4900  ORF Transcript_4249/g.4900 Transcript_4249/m.4900 type:complete len:230 (-) Transcript_4249:194-883(-)|eukprot:CAMPEP_0197849262 /NCGR_PEP_ID=MMETSP1438-20131217/11408_1 /TAXON_ID=1461541 /ORGANISM="Pterosperma sp., Strain CCMP1384" /LENGTH=229 /DNA_ID=CAMNT_0043461851 /DNA_START=151 /DNA_END=840 /DNA_ORIENTATION=+
MGEGTEARPRYYTPAEVGMHAAPDDVWVSFLGAVYNLTPLVKEHTGPLVDPIVKAAGTDISHWFDPESGHPRRHVDPITNIERPHVPMGRFVHIPPNEPVSSWDTSFGTPWWKDGKYKVGMLSQKTRVIRLKNVLTGQEDKLEVPAEELIREIRERYLVYNWHAASYTWKVMLSQEGGNDLRFVVMDMDKTLEENGVIDENQDFEAYGIPDDYYIPVIHLYYKDDLTVA